MPRGVRPAVSHNAEALRRAEGPDRHQRNSRGEDALPTFVTGILYRYSRLISLVSRCSRCGTPLPPELPTKAHRLVTAALCYSSFQRDTTVSASNSQGLRPSPRRRGLCFVVHAMQRPFGAGTRPSRNRQSTCPATSNVARCKRSLVPVEGHYLCGCYKYFPPSSTNVTRFHAYLRLIGK